LKLDLHCLRSTVARAACCGGFAGLLLAAPVQAGPLVCGPIDPLGDPVQQVCEASREVSFFVGVLDVVGVAAPDIDLVWSSDFVTAGVRSLMLVDLGTDPRLTFDAITPFVDGSLNDIEWVLGGPDGLPAPFLAQAAALEAQYGAGTLVPGAATLLRGPTAYLMGQFTGFEEDPACEQEICEVLNTWRALVDVYVQNATWTLDARSVPEPGTLGLLALALAALAARAGRSPSRG